jgi:hypothetical protein
VVLWGKKKRTQTQKNCMRHHTTRGGRALVFGVGGGVVFGVGRGKAAAGVANACYSTN